MAEYIGKEAEEIWVGDVHVANIRQENGHGDRPFIVESLTGAELHTAADRHSAEVWIALHSDTITENELG